MKQIFTKRVRNVIIAALVLTVVLTIASGEFEAFKKNFYK